MFKFHIVKEVTKHNFDNGIFYVYIKNFDANIKEDRI